MLLSRPALPACLAPAACLALAACGGAAPPAAEPSPPAPAVSAAAGEATEAMRAYAAANERMHKAMGAIDRDPDVAFVRGMIPHHRGAVEMAEVVLRHGRDPATRALAGRIIAAQRAEIAEMEAWLAEHGAAADAVAGDGANSHHGH